jgi:hypothetical protein
MQWIRTGSMQLKLQAFLILTLDGGGGQLQLRTPATLSPTCMDFRTDLNVAAMSNIPARVFRRCSISGDMR